jgi:thioester reductase-like protein
MADSTDLKTAEALITGFPGFLGSYLIEELMQRQSEATLHLLVQPKFHDEAEARIAALRRKYPDFEGEIDVFGGDITDEKLGVTDARYDELCERIGVVWHLAAIYDLAVPELQAYRVNVGGTNHILDFCECCEKFRRLNYVSTCFVAGERQGTIFEDELDEGQAHHNHYESTKFWAEVEVQRRSSDVPTTIFRPSIVVGHSRTGHTDKYDGPYYLLKALRRYPDWLPFPNIGEGETLVNIVPVDFVAEALAYLGLRPESEGEVYQLADPNPMRARDIVALALELMDKAPSFGHVPPRLVGVFLESERLEEKIGIPRQVVRYFTHDARYDTTHCREALEDAGIWCPHLSTYLQVLLDYVDRNPEKKFLDERRV